MRALWLIAISSKGISSVRLGEMLGVQQKTAWFLAHRIREMMAWLVLEPISGEVVELDEVYAGAPPRQKAGGGPSGAPSGRGPRRPLVLTAASRDGGVRMTTIVSHSRAAISEAVAKVVGVAGVFATDALPAYRFLDPIRESVKHSAKEFARTTASGLRVHVNTAESAHADLRRPPGLDPRDLVHRTRSSGQARTTPQGSWASTIGSAASISIATLVISRSDDPGRTSTYSTGCGRS
jgi:hypothetical protein